MDIRGYIRRQPWQIEFAIVLALAFGWTMPATFRALLASATPARASVALISNAILWEIIQYDVIFLSLLAPFLYVRGWTFSRLGVRPSVWGTFIGAFLALIAYGIFFRLAVLAHHWLPAVHRALIHTRMVGWGYSWTAIILTCAINSFYEEVFVCGYVVSVLSKRRQKTAAPTTELADCKQESVETNVIKAAQPASAHGARLPAAVAISVAIRVSYHLYQGIPGLIAIVPMGLLFGIWFARTRQLWPLIVAHAIFDFVGLAARAG